MTLTLWDFVDTQHATRTVNAAPPAPPPRADRANWIEPSGRGFPVRAQEITPTPPLPALALSTPQSEIRNPQSLPLPTSMEARYEAVTRLMLRTYQIRVRKWRTSMSGVAWYVTYRSGRVNRLIESPRPRGPMSAAIFLHEVGHHAIGFNVYKPRCLEEYHAWRWSLEAMAAHGLNITDQVRYRMHASLWYAVMKARRRGIRSIPEDLTPYLERPRRPRTRSTASA